MPPNPRSTSGCCYTKAGLPKLRWNSILYHNFFMPYDWVFPSEELIIFKVTCTWIKALKGTQRFSLLVSLSPGPKRQTCLAQERQGLDHNSGLSRLSPGLTPLPAHLWFSVTELTFLFLLKGTFEQISGPWKHWYLLSRKTTCRKLEIIVSFYASMVKYM